MKAIVVHEFGGREVLRYEETPKPAPKENEMLIRVIAAGVNPVDDGLRSGHYSKYFGPKPPFTPGSDIAGVVEKNRSADHEVESGRRGLPPISISIEAADMPNTHRPMKKRPL